MARGYALSDEARAGRVAQKQATRDALLNAARKLFADKGYDSTTVTEIGRVAGVSHTLINTYFGGKAGLLAAVVTGTNAPQASQTLEILAKADHPILRLREVLECWAQSDLADRRLLTVLHATSWDWGAEAEAANRLELAQFTKALETLIVEARAAGMATGHIAPADVAEALMAIYTWGMRRALYDALQPKEAIAALWPQVVAAAGLRETV